MTTIMFSSLASPCSTSNLKRKRDEFGAVMSMNSCPSLADHGQPCPGMGTLNLRGDIHSRTIKRSRNKPKEREVHEYTLQKLFNAQTSKQLSNQVAIRPAHPPLPSPPTQKASSRPSISNYFAPFFTSSKPHPKPSNKPENLPNPELSPSITICEDCDRPLQEREMYLSGEGQCINCRRTVCSEGCSVAVNDGLGGEGRVCLECAL
ncbi:hypothetical protein BGX38DRAFT_1227113, partial [Terfezia claveryi]